MALKIGLCRAGSCSEEPVSGRSFCQAHQQQFHRDQNRRRGTAAQRGYGAQWQRLSKAFLSTPENSLCARCSMEGRTRPATLVDHILPASLPGVDELDEANWQALCESCHRRKTHEDRLAGLL